MTAPERNSIRILAVDDELFILRLYHFTFLISPCTFCLALFVLRKQTFFVLDKQELV
jgi:hypothetical protein